MTASTMFSANMFFRETYRVLPGRANQFQQIYKNEYAPGLADFGLKLAGLWSSSPVQGNEVEHLALWEMKSGEQMMRLSKALDAVGEVATPLQKIRDSISLLIDRRDGWTLLGYEPTLNSEQWKQSGLLASTLLYEEIDIVPNQHPLFNRTLRTNYLRMLKGSGINLIGVLRPQLHSIEAVVIWDLKDGLESLAWLDKIDQTPEYSHWLAVSQTSRTGSRGRILHAV